MSVARSRLAFQSAALTFARFRDEESAGELEKAAERFVAERKHARERRERWKERKRMNPVYSRTCDLNPSKCRIDGCRYFATMRPVLLFPGLDGDPEPVRVETAMLDVCEEHARSVGPEAYTGNPDVWRAIVKVWTDAWIEPPSPDSASVVYERIVE
jgi:hypothetical protein